jgi:hypothetical protein
MRSNRLIHKFRKSAMWLVLFCGLFPGRAFSFFNLGLIVSAKSVVQLQMFAGPQNPAGFQEGTWGQVRLDRPKKMVSDGTYVYVTEAGSAIIRKIDISTGVSTTLAGSPYQFAITDGTGSAARFVEPIGIAYDGSTYLYVADARKYIRKINKSTGAVTTFAGDGNCGYADGTGTAASFCGLKALAYDGTYLYTGEDYDNCLIRRVNPSTAVVTTWVGSVGNCTAAAGTGTSAGAGAVHEILYDSGTIYVGGDGFISKINTTTAALTIIDGAAGNPLHSFLVSGTTLYCSTGNVVTSYDLTTSSWLSDVAGDYYELGAVDANGTSARFNFYYWWERESAGMLLINGNIWIADTQGSTIRKIDLGTGDVTTLLGLAGLSRANTYAGGPADATGTAARFSEIKGIAVVGGNVYVDDGGYHRIRKIDGTTTAVTTYAGSGACAINDGIGTAADICYPTALGTDGTDLYFMDSEATIIRKIQLSNQQVTTLAGSPGNTGSADGVGAAARFGGVYGDDMGLAGGGGYLYIADVKNCAVRKLNLSNNSVTTLAGTAGNCWLEDGTGAAASFRGPQHLALVGTDLYVSDFSRYDDVNDHAIRKVDTVTGVVTTVAGGAAGYADGTGTAALFHCPGGLVSDGTYLFIADGCNGRIRKMNLVTYAVTTAWGTGLIEDLDGPVASANTWYPQYLGLLAGKLLVGNMWNVRIAR